jgi:hypothetical protein
VDVFSIVNQFVYTRHLSDKQGSDVGWEMLVRAWLFGDKYLMPSLQNRAMSILVEKVAKDNLVPTDQLKLIYSNTLPGSPLRKFIVDLAAYRIDMARIDTKYWSYESLADLVRVMGAKTKEDFGKFSLPEANKRTCYYHIHADGENCDTQS